MMNFIGLRNFGNCFSYGNGIAGPFNRGLFIMPMITMALLIILTVVLVIFAVKKINKSSRQQTYSASLEELKIRYAKGEISDDEYIRIKKVLY